MLNNISIVQLMVTVLTVSHDFALNFNKTQTDVILLDFCAWAAEGGARGARVPPTFIRGVLNTPILDLRLRHGDHVTLF